MNDKVKVTASAKCPPWAGYASPNVLTVKVGGYFFTIEVQK